MSKPKPIEVGETRASVTRGPRADGRYYWRARRKGARDTVWTGWATREEALQDLAHVVVSGLPTLSNRGHFEAARNVGELLDYWMAFQQRRADNGDIAPLTVLVYRRNAGYWKQAIGDILPDELSRSVVDDAWMEMLTHGGAPRTVALACRLLRAITKWGTSRGHCSKVDLTGIGPKIDDEMFVNCSTTPTPGQVASVLSVAGDDCIADLIRLQAMIGCRIGEVAALLNQDFKPADGPRLATLVLTGRDLLNGRRGKTGRREIPVASEVASLLKRHWEEEESEKRLFSDLPDCFTDHVNRRLRNACQDRKIPRFTSHGLRRMVVQRLLDAGNNAKIVSKLTGHTVQTLLRFYVRPCEEQLNDAVRRADLGNFSPRGRVLKLPKRSQ